MKKRDAIQKKTAGAIAVMLISILLITFALTGLGMRFTRQLVCCLDPCHIFGGHSLFHFGVNSLYLLLDNHVVMLLHNQRSFNR